MTDFDFQAADHLSRQLTQLIEKLDWLLWLRSTQRKSLLGGEGSDNWQGAKRRHFETDFARGQSSLTRLKDQARSLQTEVATATRTARAKSDGD
ncbi:MULTISPECIES: hypothetical protein [unclassified Streptomyces]|uniref:hypothetical protein n=1 Tax=unclassified Streptomyces TaxID=2593676 RepID=UPI00278BB1C4|nr:MULTISPECIES: hypothetical protein [unclassified Streptomyces]